MKSYGDQIRDYCDKVLDGTYASGRLVKLAVKRHVQDLENGDYRGLKWDEDAAERACKFFPLLQHTRGAYKGRPFQLRCFQVFIVGSLFGWKTYYPADGDLPAFWYRRFREALVTMGKGGGKSPLTAAIANKFTFADVDNPSGEPVERAESYCFATKRDQAKQLFDEACHQAASNPTLKKATEKYKLTLKGPRDSFLQAMGSDTRDDGIVPHFLCCDEIHRLGEWHRDMYTVLKASLSKSPNQMLFKISTAGDEESHIFLEELGQAEKVLNQVNSPVDEPWGDEQFVYVAQLDKDDDIYDEANWPKANPMLLEPGGPVQIQGLRAMAAKAEAGDRNAERDFRRLHCNQQVSSINKPIHPDSWALGNGALPADLTKYPAFGGFDLSRSRDFSAVTICWDLGERWAIKSWAWTVEERAESLKSVEFLDVLEEGNVYVHEGNVIEKAHVRRKINELQRTFNVQSWAYDPNWASETADLLFEEFGIHCVEVAQTPANYNEPVNKFIEAVDNGKVIHGGDKLLTWCALNLAVQTNSAGLQMPSKTKSVNKIDPIVAGLMAWREMLFGENIPTPQVW